MYASIVGNVSAFIQRLDSLILYDLYDLYDLVFVDSSDVRQYFR